MIANLIRAALFCPPGTEGFWGRPLLLWGEPGVGKTHIVKAIAKSMGLFYNRISPAERGEGQFGVVPVPQPDGYLGYPAPAWVLDLVKGGVLFVDEISTAPPALQAPLLGLVQLRTLGLHVFDPRVRVLGAANETIDAAGGWDLAPALANRFGHLSFDGLSSDDWAVGLLSGFAAGDDATQAFDVAAEETRVLAAWPGAIAQARGEIAGFIRRHPDLLHKRPEKAAASSSRAWPSRRSVEYATDMLASAHVQGLTDSEREELMAAFVGNAWVREYVSWRVNLDLPDPADILDGRATFTHDVRRLDRTMTVLGACAALVVPANAVKRTERATACWNLIGTLLKDASDCAIPAARALLKAKAVGQGRAMTDVLGKVNATLVAAGLTV